MKRIIISLTMTFMLLLSGFTMTGCGPTFGEDAANKLEKDVYDTYELLKSVYADSATVYDVSEYLYDWAAKNDFVARKLGGGNIIITKPASVDDPALPYAIIQCAIDKSSPKDASQRAAIALSTIMNIQENGKTGVLFTVTDSNKYTGAKRLSPDNLDSDYFIHLESNDVSQVNVGSAGTADYEMSIRYEMEKPTTTIAYRLAISGLSGQSSSILKGPNPNAILIVSNFLTGCRASGMQVELADFDGGRSVDTYPASARAIIMVNQNNETRLLSRFESALEKFEDKYGDDFPDASYTLVPVAAPKYVINNDDAANILSLLYTTINGVYKTSDEKEGDLIAVANIGKLTTGSKSMKMRILARSIDETVLKEMSESYYATAYLSDASFRILSRSAVWPSNPTNDFSKEFVKAAENAGLDELSIGPTFLQSECAVFYQKKKDINMISFSVNNEDAFLDAKSLLFFLTDLVQTQN